MLHVTNKVKDKPLDRESVIEGFPEVFNGLGNHNKIKAKFIVDHTVDPVVQKPLKVPYNLEKKARAEDNRLKNIDVKEEVPDSEPTTWCINQVIAPKTQQTR